MSSVEIVFAERDVSEFEVLFERERVSDAQFARLLRDIDELTVWFSARATVPGDASARDY